MRLSSPHVDAVDGLRAVAVLAVLAYHMLAAGSSAPAAWIGCGARGVDLFFAISGFCLAYPYLSAFRAGDRLSIGYESFMARRILRIAPPYWVALLLFGLLSFTGFGLPTAPHAHLEGAASLREFGREAAFFPGIEPAYNLSFWTLGIEMRWYLLFPLLLTLYARSRIVFLALGATCYVLYFLGPLRIGDQGVLPCFMLGIVAADLRLTHSPLERYAPAAAAAALVLAAFLQSRTIRIDHANPIWHFAAFALVVAASNGTFARVLRFRPLVLTGVASYSIYLVHQPVLSSLASAGFSPALAALSAMACGFAFYLAVERPCLDKRLRDPAQTWLLSLLPERSRRAMVTVRATATIPPGPL